jgi:predicted nucleic acid-binding protein
MRVLLDTSAYSAFMKGHETVKLALQTAEEILFNPIVLGELKAGFHAGKRRTRNEQELRTF